MRKSWPGRSWCSATRFTPTQIPFVLPRSVNTQPSALRCNRAWRKETELSGITSWLSGPRPTVTSSPRMTKIDPSPGIEAGECRRNFGIRGDISLKQKCREIPVGPMLDEPCAYAGTCGPFANFSCSISHRSAALNSLVRLRRTRPLNFEHL